MRVAAISAAVLASAVWGGSVHAADDVTGVWRGDVQEAGKTYPMVMTLVTPSEGYTDYPALKCRGLLRGIVRDGQMIYRETIVEGSAAAGTGSCADGEIVVEVSGDAMQWTWRAVEDPSYVATAQLRRSPAR